MSNPVYYNDYDNGPVADALSFAEAAPKTNTWVQADARMRKHCQGKETTASAALRILAAEIRSKSNG